MALLDAMFSLHLESVLFIVCPLLILAYWRMLPKRRGGEPPLVPSWLPWLGSALDFGRKPDAFIAKNHRKFGDVFVAVIMGQRMVFINDRRWLPEIWRHHRSLSFEAFKDKMLVGPLGPNSSKLLEKTGYDIDVPLHTCLRGEELDNLNANYHDALRAVLGLSPVEGSQEHIYKQDNLPELALGVWTDVNGRQEWQRVDLTSIADVIVVANYNSVLGPNSCTRGMVNDIVTFIKGIPLMSGPLPHWLPIPQMQAAIAARERLLQAPTMLHLGKHASAVVLAREQMALDRGVERHVLSVMNVGVMTGALINTRSTVFWVIAELLRNPEAKAAILSESDKVLGQNGSFSIDPKTLKEQLRQLVVLNAFIEEVLRYRSEGFAGRLAVEDTTLSLRDKKLSIRKGDQVMIPTGRINRDTTVYGADANEFRWDRFLNDDRTGQRQFTDKNGSPAVNHFLSFGGGTVLCPGRHFALAQLKVSTLTFLRTFDIELESPDQPLPEICNLPIGIEYPEDGQHFWVKIRLHQ